MAKLRLHTSSTLQIFKATTKTLGQKLRYWVKKTCAAFDTRELPKEASARYRRKAAAASKAGKGRAVPPQGKGGQRRRGRGRGQMPMNSPRTANQQEESPDAHNSKIRKAFNMCTYKLHALGHYIAAIAQFGTTDNYSTQMVDHMSFLSLFLLIFSCFFPFFFRENLNIVESNVSMHEQINAKLLGARLRGSNGVKVFWNDSGSGSGRIRGRSYRPGLLPLIRRLCGPSRPMSHLKILIHYQKHCLKFITTSQTQHDWKRTFFDG